MDQDKNKHDIEDVNIVVYGNSFVHCVYLVV